MFQPAMRLIIKNVAGIKQGDKHIDVEESTPVYIPSSSNRFWIWEMVTGSFRGGNISAPFRIGELFVHKECAALA